MSVRLPNLSFKKRIKQSENEERKKKVFDFEKQTKKSAHEVALFRKERREPDY